jgi:hypothetical protein
MQIEGEDIKYILDEVLTRRCNPGSCSECFIKDYCIEDKYAGKIFLTERGREFMEFIITWLPVMRKAIKKRDNERW